MESYKKARIAPILVSFTMILAGCTEKKSPADYVNPFIGASTNTTAAHAYHGLGKTFPGATTPFGMVQVSPNTITGGDNGSGYSYEHQTIEGFAMTQMSGVGWYGDLGNFLVMPTTGPLKKVAGREDGSIDGYCSHYDKDTETATAGYYSTFLTDYGIQAECTATPHCGFLRFTYPKNEQSRIQIDLARRVGGTSLAQYAQVVDDHTLRGWMRCTPGGGGWGNGDGQPNYTVYFYAQFSKPLKDYGFWSTEIPMGEKRRREEVTAAPYIQRVADTPVQTGITEIEGKHVGFYTDFATRKGEKVEMKVGISFVDMEGAQKNFEAEAKGCSFSRARKEAHKLWNKELRRMEIEGGSEDEKTVFYTALYHTMIDPRLYTDVDGRYVGGDHKVHDAQGAYQKRTIFSGWDVFRSQFPLQTLINPELVSDMVNSLVGMAEESHKQYLERWEFLNAYSGCMLGNPAISVILDAYKKGIRTFDVEKAYHSCVVTSKKFSNGELGYTPGSVSHTLEYAYSDWCMSQLAKELGFSNEEKRYTKAAQNYRLIWDTEKEWFRPRNADGSWQEWPEKGRLQEGYGCVESDLYQQGWFVPHDVEGMVELMGGKEKVLADLEKFFEGAPKDFLWNPYYNHANEPVHNVPFLFNRLDAPRLTQKWTRTICQNAYSNKVEGLVGNEDVGQMSAWYVLAASGLHPYCPGDTRVEITSPLFDRIRIKLDAKYYTGKTFEIVTYQNAPDRPYIEKALLNGKPLDRMWLDFSEIAAGGKLELYMTN